jgi:hypothetical protein
VDSLQTLISCSARYELEGRRAAIVMDRRLGNIVQFMKQTLVLVDKTNVTKLRIDRRLIYRKPHSQARESFDINILLIGGHGDEIDVRRSNFRMNSIVFVRCKGVVSTHFPLHPLIDKG